MTELFSGAGPRRVGRVMAGVALACVLAGCGGGGGGSSSSGGGGTTTTGNTVTVLASQMLSSGSGAATLTGTGSEALAQVLFPAGAIPAASGAVTASLGVDSSPPSTGNYALESQAYDLEPAGQTFSGDVSITLPYTPPSTALGSEIFYYSASSGQWVQVQGANNGGQIINTTHNTITVQVSSFAAGTGTNGAGPTYYAVLGIAPPGPP